MHHEYAKTNAHIPQPISSRLPLFAVDSHSHHVRSRPLSPTPIPGIPLLDLHTPSANGHIYARIVFFSAGVHVHATNEYKGQVVYISMDITECASFAAYLPL